MLSPGSIQTSFVAAAALKTSAINPEEDGHRPLRFSSRCVDIQIQTVFAESREGLKPAHRARTRSLQAIVAEVGGIERLGLPRLGFLRRAKAIVAGGRGGKGDTLVVGKRTKRVGK